MNDHERTEFPYLIYIQFEESRKAYSFGSHVKADTGDQVVVETVRGQEIGTVCMPAMPFDSRKAKDDCKPVLRLATPEDLARREENKVKAADALAVCTQCIRRLGLDMHLISSEYTLDCAKIIFTYVSDERVDFRQLLKDLAHQLHCRIELRQVGPRNKAKMVGGIGSCGMECCCSRFMSEFDTVSINMAKNQLLALNISKLSGQCGKLKCCLRFENDLYTQMRRDLPRINSQLVFEGTRYRLSSMNLLQQQAKLENREEVRFVEFSTLWPERGSEENTDSKDGNPTVSQGETANPGQPADARTGSEKPDLPGPERRSSQGREKNRSQERKTRNRDIHSRENHDASRGRRQGTESANAGRERRKGHGGTGRKDARPSSGRGAKPDQENRR